MLEHPNAETPLLKTPNLSHAPLRANQGGIGLNVLLIRLDRRLVALLTGPFLSASILTEQLLVLEEAVGASRRIRTRGINIRSCERGQKWLEEGGLLPVGRGGWRRWRTNLTSLMIQLMLTSERQHQQS